MRRTFVAAATAAVVLGAGVAWATTLTVTSQDLGAATLTRPVFFPNSVVIANGGTAGRPDRFDTITIVFNKLVQLSSVCAGAPQSNSSASGFLFTLADGGTGINDTLSIGGGTSCPTLHFGSFTLGSPNYRTGTAITYPSSTIAITLGASTTTVVLTFGTASTAATTVSTATIVKYTPDPVMTDTGAHAVGTSTSSTTSAVQF